MPHAPAIRPGSEADVPSVLALWHAAESLPSATDTEDALHLLLRRDPESLLVAQVGEEIIGSLIVAWDGWRGSFYRLAVHPNWRRQGIATALVRVGEERLRALGAIRLTAIVASEERVAMSLWAAAGYERQPDQSRFVRMLSGSS
jgi:ribosomal protein S18 acetylase RimI-like enzyme